MMLTQVRKLGQQLMPLPLLSEKQSRSEPFRPLLFTSPETTKSGLIKMIFVSLIIALSLAACSSPEKISGQEPVLALDSMQVDGERLRVRIRVSNLNDFQQRLSQPTLSLGLAELPTLQSLDTAPSLGIAANSRELLNFEFTLNENVQQIMQRLTQREFERLPWTMQLFESETRPISTAQGFVHAVPGQPGRFR